MSRSLRDRRSFLLLTGTQFLTVANDNLFKQAVLLLAVSRQGQGGDLQSLAQALFSLPFLLFAVLAGDCADRWPKRRVILATKLAEVVVMLLAAWAFLAGDLTALLAVVFLMGTQSAFLGPAKYGSLPELSTRQGLPRANGVFQASVLGAILLGTGSAGHVPEPHLPWLGVGMAACAGLGFLLALGMRTVPAANPGKRLRFDPVGRLVRGLREARTRTGLLPALLGHALFWCVGSLMLIAWNEFLAKGEDGKALVEVSQGTWSMGLAALSLFMALGAVFAGQVQRRQVPRHLVLLGAGGMAVGFLVAGLVPVSPVPLFATMAIASFFSGCYLIPLRTLVQKLPPYTSLGATLGTSQMLDFLFISGGALLRPSLRLLGVGPQGLLAVLGIVLIAAMPLLARTLPKAVALTADGSADAVPRA
ncbi:MAG: MFS transporter [Planctomycetota bacterium]